VIDEHAVVGVLGAGEDFLVALGEDVLHVLGEERLEVEEWNGEEVAVVPSYGFAEVVLGSVDL